MVSNGNENGRVELIEMTMLNLKHFCEKILFKRQYYKRN